MIKLNNNITIYHGDCFEVMDKLKQDRIILDLILTDPPYGTINNLKKFNYTSWDVKLDTRKMFRASADLLRENGRMILFSQEPYTSELRTKHPADLNFTQSAIWLKRTWGNPLGCNKNLLNVYEDINLFKKKYDNFTNPVREYSRNILKFLGLTSTEIEKQLGHRKLEHFFCCDTIQFEMCSELAYNELIEKYHINKMDSFMDYKTLKESFYKDIKKATFNLNEKNKKINCFEYPKDVEKYHTAQKPVNLLKDLITTYTNENDLVLDFTMGSGSTGVACALTNRRFIGIELNKDFFNIAKQRIEGAIK